MTQKNCGLSALMMQFFYYTTIIMHYHVDFQLFEMLSTLLFRVWDKFVFKHPV